MKLRWTFRGQSRALGSLVFAGFGIVEVDQAVFWAERSVALAIASGDLWTQACAFAAQAAVTTDVGDPRDAQALYEQALDLFSAVGDRRNQAIIQLNLGVLAAEGAADDRARSSSLTPPLTPGSWPTEGPGLPLSWSTPAWIFMRGETMRQDVASRKRSSRR